MKTYKNPILKGFNPDPSICRVDDDYYMITSTFEYFPGVPIYHSKNLIDWSLIGHCLTRTSQLPLNGQRASKGIYAPTLRYHDGVFYMVTTNVGNGGNFYVTTTDIRGEWSDPVWVDVPGIDPTIVFDEDTAYITTNRVGDRHVIGLTELNVETGELIGETKWISDGTGGSYVEAPHIYKRNGYYYLILAEGGTQEGHMVTIHRANDIFGPYESCPHNPILTHRDRTREQIKGTGHADLVWDKAENCWMVCLGFRTLPVRHLHNLGRETFLTPVLWENDWPVVGDDGEINSVMEGPLPMVSEDNLKPANELKNIEDIIQLTSHGQIHEQFTGGKMGLDWNYIRNRDEAAYRLEEGRLTLINQGIGLSSFDQSPCFAGIRQTEFKCRFTAKVTISEKGYGGITAYQNGDYHYDLVLRSDGNKKYALIRKKIFDLEVALVETEVTIDEELELIIEADETYYSFYYADRDGSKVKLGQGMAAALCTEVTHFTTFTGVYMGLFCDEGQMTVSEVFYQEV